MVVVANLHTGVYALDLLDRLHPRRALFGALIVPTLPVVVLQSLTPGRSHVVAGSFVVAAWRALAELFTVRRPQLALAAVLATGLRWLTSFMRGH